MTWIIQRKIFRSDWETLRAVEARSKSEALRPFEHLTRSQSDGYKLRAVSEAQAERDYQAGRADNFKRKFDGIAPEPPTEPRAGDSYSTRSVDLTRVNLELFTAQRRSLDQVINDAAITSPEQSEHLCGLQVLLDHIYDELVPIESEDEQ